jgi:MHS family proline/betaine transporter-like MFS transporter
MRQSIKVSLFGSILEWYDFAIIGALAPILSSVFFPSEDEIISIIRLFFVFSIGFLARPIGALYFGYFGDKNSRLDGLTRSLLIVSISTLLIGFIPAYDTIGVMAPLLLLALRFIQGVGTSGEHAGAITLIYESNHKDRFLTSISLIGIMLGMFFGFFSSTILHYFYTNYELSEFGWRLPFIVGGILGLCGTLYRYTIGLDTIYNRYNVANPIRTLFRFKLSHVIFSIGVYWFCVVIFYATYFYIPYIAVSFYGLKDSYISYLTFINMSLFMAFLLVFCYANKYFNAVYMMKVSLYLFLILGVPSFYFSLSSSYLLLFFGQLILTIINCLYLAPVALLLSEVFCKEVRYSGISISVNISSAMFGGTTPIIMLYISTYFNNPRYSVFYFIIASIISLLCLLLGKSLFLVESKTSSMERVGSV